MSERREAPRDWRLLEVEELVRCPRKNNDYVKLDVCEDCEFQMMVLDSDGQEVVCKYRGEKG